MVGDLLGGRALMLLVHQRRPARGGPAAARLGSLVGQASSRMRRRTSLTGRGCLGGWEDGRGSHHRASGLLRAAEAVGLGGLVRALQLRDLGLLVSVGLGALEVQQGLVGCLGLVSSGGGGAWTKAGRALTRRAARRQTRTRPSRLASRAGPVLVRRWVLGMVWGAVSGYSSWWTSALELVCLSGR